MESNSFASSYLGKMRALVGSRMLLVPGSRVVIENSEGKILLQRRSDFNTWGLPGGNAEEGESLDAVARREVKEETGLDALILVPFAFGCNPALETFTFPNGDQCQFFVLNFVCQKYSGEQYIADGESLDLRWFPRSVLPDMLPNMRKSVEAYGRFLDTNEFQMV